MRKDRQLALFLRAALAERKKDSPLSGAKTKKAADPFMKRSALKEYERWSDIFEGAALDSEKLPEAFRLAAHKCPASCMHKEADPAQNSASSLVSPPRLKSAGAYPPILLKGLGQRVASFRPR